jgi:hypothetical protein
LDEYNKAIDNLTIDPANRLQRKIETLTIEKSRLDKKVTKKCGDIMKNREILLFVHHVNCSTGTILSA